MHFTYDKDLNKDELMQGDVLDRTPALDDLLREVHPHFFNHPKNLYFIVLTQSCDLVPRHAGGKCKAPYISIAPVRSLSLLAERHIAQNALDTIRAELPVLGNKAKSKANEFFQRVLNNNESGYFYLEAADTPLLEDSVAFLNLSIAIKSELHFQKCLDAKILQLTMAFQAKLGWLVGQSYSRVGTEDWPADKLNAKVRRALQDTAIWVEDDKLSELEAAFKARVVDDPDTIMSARDIAAAAKRIPNRKSKVITAAERVLRDVLGNEREGEVKKLVSRLSSDADITALLR